MTKLNQNHYAIKLLKEMLPYGISEMRIGAITVTLNYPEKDIGVYTLSLINRDLKKGLVFTLFKNLVCGCESWCAQKADICLN